MGGKRAERVGPLIYEELSMVLARKLEDPRLKGVTLTKARVTPDLKTARVYFSMIGDEEEIEQAKTALNKAKGIFKGHLGKNLELRYVPDIEFHYDKNLAYADRIEKVIADLKAERTDGRDNGQGD